MWTKECIRVHKMDGSILNLTSVHKICDGFNHNDLRMIYFFPTVLYLALKWKSHLCVPFLGIARPQSQFLHWCACEQFIYFQDRFTYILQQNRQIYRGNIHINRSQTPECGNWNCGRAIPFLAIFVSNFRYWFFAVHTLKNIEILPSVKKPPLQSLHCEFFSNRDNGVKRGWHLPEV